MDVKIKKRILKYYFGIFFTAERSYIHGQRGTEHASQHHEDGEEDLDKN